MGQSTEVLTDTQRIALLTDAAIAVCKKYNELKSYITELCCTQHLMAKEIAMLEDAIKKAALPGDPIR